MQRLFLMPDKELRVWQRVFYSLVLTSIEAFLAILVMLVGVPLLITPTVIAPTSVLALMPLWMVYLWGAGMVAGGALSLTGIMMSQYRIERIGVLFMAMVAVIFVVALVPLLPAATIPLTTYVFFALAMFARYWVLGRIIAIVKRVRDEVS